MNTPKLFNSKTEPIPRIRPDLDIIPVQNNGDSYLYFHDVRGYITPNFALDRSAGSVLSLLDGHKSISDLKPYLANGVNPDQLLQFVQLLDKHRLLHSPHFRKFARQHENKYEQSDIHQAITPGSSYPGDPHKLTAFLDEAFDKYGTDSQQKSTGDIKALYAPHIDPRVGIRTYVESFQLLKNITPKRVVLLATSHYASMYPDIYKDKPFIISRKNFEMPLGTVPADREAIDQLLIRPDDTGLSSRDRAHRIEHSIELHLLFLQYIWQHNFSIIPIVIGGFDELFYMKDTHLSRQIERFARQLRARFGHDDDTLFLISGDLAHVGKKFGDERPAASMNREVADFDEQFLEAGQQGSTRRMLQLIKRDYDPYRICGFPPLYTFLQAFPEMKGQIISYDRWDERERESAVTFGSILYS